MSVDITQLNGATEAARNLLEQGMAANLNEVAPEPIEIALHEYVEDAETGRRKLMTTLHTIETYVPMRIFNRVVATQRAAQQARAKWLTRVVDEDKEEEEDPMLLWQLRQILSVWKMTEPDMTLERLQDGLDFTQVNGVFSRFFARYLNPLLGVSNR